jgi:serine/threonine protein kinase
LEHLSASDRIIDIYGYCGTIEAAKGDVVAEMVPTSGYIQHNNLDQKQIDDVHPMKNLTLLEKLDMALVMAESLADFHGYKGGVIAHRDVHPEQWLRTLDGKLKLNDFGSGEILDFDPWNQIYCNVYPCYSGCYHAPEELKCVRGNEAFDVYSMGNNIYVLLTGLWPYYSEPEFDERVVATRKVKFGVRPYLDERYRHRSLVERRLVEIMEECWEIDFEKRVPIFEVVRQLADLKILHAGERPHLQSQ